MCLLTYLQPGAQPNPKHLAAGAAVNRDGHGFAIVDNGTLFIRRSLSPATAIREFVQLRQEHPSGPAIFHSRLGTGGLRTTYNIHPFFVGSDNLTVVAHNGILWSTPPGDKRCDTRMFAEGMLPATFSDLDSFRLRTTLESFLGRYNKMAILTVNPGYTNTAYLLNAESGRWVDDTWYSNSSYLRATDWRWFDGLDANAGTVCEICLKYGHVDPDTQICGRCHYCNECCRPEPACRCHPGERHERLSRDREVLAITAGPSS